ncbi:MULTISPECIES: LacI family DNA-binding transcriptional regulator [unclassified Lactobacillus]|uniref:LacI family DNA-binding transcriptional regulator n=1 Tax=unclassified Lactobacillus TaxID=2620435 RepID=UPI00226AD540|nr:MULTISPECIES: LacI family DNA-binding transcriptional regulator [unclassified Lactobacillus]MCX8720700.1 LacI family DNA-binding transcriptional regulator [Lactobacillus sp. B4010]MCX8731844.1 LacI family DNA-binding transcriptional regulator [Lactobacillus sp. B4015]MCX8733882.1 LacI family DNA-binding transcriptional regulator [Lactobacillus sp. B4012]
MKRKKSHEKATIRNVAELANVSVASVSRYLNNKATGRLSKEKAQAIEKAIKTLNYIPDIAARQMATNQSKTIAVVVSNIDDYFSTELFKGASNILRLKGYEAFLLDTNADQNREKELIKTVSSSFFDGLLFQPFGSNFRNIKSEFVHDIPTVILDRRLASLHWPQVISNNIEVSKNATKYFLNKGCDDFLILSSEVKIASTRRDRYSGICFVAKPEQIHLIQIDEETYNYSAIKRKIEAFLQKQKEKGKKTLIFCFKERWLLEFIPMLMADGYLDNENVFVTGFADTKLAQLILPQSKLISQNPYLMGASAAEILLNLLVNKVKPQEFQPLVIAAKF